MSISGLVVEYIVAIDVTRVRFPADASFISVFSLLGQDLKGWLNCNMNHEQNSPDGTRTHNLLLRRETPYPLGHRTLNFYPKFPIFIVLNRVGKIL